MAATVNGEKPLPPSGVFDLDYNSTSVQLQLIGLGFGFYTLTFLLSHFLSVLLSRTYRCLSAKEKVWDINAVLTTEPEVQRAELALVLIQLLTHTQFKPHYIVL